jgi:hypothetical protein
MNARMALKRLFVAHFLIAGLGVLAIHCAHSESIPADALPILDGGPLDAGSADAEEEALDAGHDAYKPPRCNLQKPFGTPQAVGGLPQNAVIRLSPDELTVYYADSARIMRSTRARLSDPFTGNYEVPIADATGTLGSPSLTEKALTLYYAQSSGSSFGGIKVTSRAKDTDPFGTSILLNNGRSLVMPYVSPDGTRLYAVDQDVGGPGVGTDIVYLSLPADAGTGWTRLPDSVNSTTLREFYPVVSADGLTLYFARDASADQQIMVSRRDKPTDAFGTATPVTELNTDDSREGPEWISPDGCTLYFHRINTGSTRYAATRGL